MRKINAFISLLLTLCMLSPSVLAAEINTVITTETETQNTILDDTSFDITNIDIDNSELDVRVIKQNGEEQSTVFTGKLKDYDNGAWIHTDFSDIEFFIIFDWDNTESEAVYIVC